MFSEHLRAIIVKVNYIVITYPKPVKNSVDLRGSFDILLLAIY